MIKVVYFDEEAASDYITIHNGGQIDWTTTENKEKLAKIIGEIDAQAKGSVNVFSLFKASMSGKANAMVDAETNKIFERTLRNTIITDYLSIASKDDSIHCFKNAGVYAPEESVSLYKMYASYLNVVPKDQMPIDVNELNKAILGERGYYQMLLNNEEKPTSVLRFNNAAFKNNYSLADLSKMNLSYYAVKVGACTLDQLSLENEFSNNIPKHNHIDVADVIDGVDLNNENDALDMYDVVLAGVVVNE